MSLISINIRGLGVDVKWKYLQELVMREKPGILCIQETKVVHLCSQRDAIRYGVPMR